MLTYTLWYGTSADSITTKGKSSNPTKPGQSVTIEQNEGLSNDTRYWFKVVVSDGTYEIASDNCNESTYCKGEYCEGVSYSYTTCTKCDSNHKVKCPSCDGLGYKECRERVSATQSRASFTYDAICKGCRSTIPAFTTCYDNYYTCSAGHTTEWASNGQFSFCTITCANSYASSTYCGHKLGTCYECNRTGTITCPNCKGEGQIQVTGSCTAHTITGRHYYCTSSSHHGDNVGQYHK